jgi:hypothetical protein
MKNRQKVRGELLGRWMVEGKGGQRKGDKKLSSRGDEHDQGPLHVCMEMS